MSRSLSVLPALVAAGCALAPVDLTHKQCPCDEPGWSCDRSGGEPGVCVRGPSSEGDAGACNPDESACGALATPLVCDGFEGETISSQWNASAFGEGSHRRTTDAARGCGGLEIHASGEPYRYFLSQSLPGAPRHEGELHVRTWLRLDPEMPIRDSVAALYVSESTAPHDGVGFHVLSGPALTLFVERASDEVYRPIDLTYGRWTCVELHFEIAASGTVSLDVDGIERARFEGIDLLTAGGYEIVGIGTLQHGAGEMQSRIRFDDLVIDDAPIGCL